MGLDMVIYVAAVVGAILLARRWRTSSFVRNHWPLWTVLFLIVVILTGYLTYHAPDWIIFADLG
jgi:cytochrome c oxidase assembly factor CtaG